MMGYEISTPVFSGPLDVLLELIEKHELDITKVALAQVTDEFLHRIDVLREARLLTALGGAAPSTRQEVEHFMARQKLSLCGYLEAFLALAALCSAPVLLPPGAQAYTSNIILEFDVRGNELIDKEIILEALPEEWTGKLMREMWLIDETIDRLGYLRLSTAERTVSHMGNLLDGRWLGEAEKLGIEISTQLTLPSSRGRGLRRLLMRLPGVRWFLQGLYNRLFWILSAPHDDPRM